MSTSSEKSLCTSEDKDAQERNSETRANENEEAQKDERRNLPYDLVKKIYPSDFRNWPILSLLKPEFITRICMIMVYGNCGNRALIVTQEKDVYTLDYNKDDHFKTGDTHIGLYPKKVEELCGKNIKTFACNSYFVLALTEEGEVYSWQFSKERKSDDGSRTLVSASKPTRVAGLSEKRIVDIACGSYHSLALTNDGKVYAWGENKHRQLGYVHDYGSDLPRQVKHELEGKKIDHIACGSMFNMVVTEGKLYGWGNNENGQISIYITPVTTTDTISEKPIFFWGIETFVTNVQVESQKYYEYPHKITVVSGKAIVKVACGSRHTLALTDEGKIYAWGKNDKGQVGVKNNLEISAPVMVDVPEMVLDIAAYDNLSVAVGSNRTVFVWGDCFGQDITAPFPTEFSSIHDAFAYSTMRVMHKPLTVPPNKDVEEVLNILESLGFGVLGTVFDDPLTSDFRIIVKDQSIHVHKAFLKIRCPHFTNNLQNEHCYQNVSDPSAVCMVSNKFSYIVYKAFLKYLYTGTVDIPLENASELMKLADECCETNLKRECGRIIEQAITTSNVALFYSKAVECTAKELEEFCFQFAVCHMKDVVLSEEYIKLDTSIKDNFMRRAAQENAFRT
ncbi:unnamed protein product [Lasius platythorax]|uniref:BTB domain-containing protein n=1 Tax=Lasius platythorax TaxID=488582 RepID=A0AAV2NEP4_9HYME